MPEIRIEVFVLEYRCESAHINKLQQILRGVNNKDIYNIAFLVMQSVCIARDIYYPGIIIGKSLINIDTKYV